MYPTLPVVFLYGLIQLRPLGASCPQNISNEAKFVQFCSDSEVTSSDIYIYSYDAFNRAINCTCNFEVTAESLVHLETTTNQIYDCRSRIEYGHSAFSLIEACGSIDVILSSKMKQNYTLILVNGDIINKMYCLHLFTENAIKIKLRCHADYSTTTPNALTTIPKEDVVCPPSNSNAGAQTLQFCSDAEVSSNDIYIDSSAASTRVTNCICSFKVTYQTRVFLQTTNDQTDDCRTRIFYRINGLLVNEFCGEINLGIQTAMNQSPTYDLVLIIEHINLKAYCLHLTGYNNSMIELKCFKDTPILKPEITSSSTTSILEPEITSTEPIVTTGFNAIFSTPSASTNDIRKLSQTTRRHLSRTVTSTYTKQNQGPPLHILVPVVGAVVLVVAVLIIFGIVCIRGRYFRKKNLYEENRQNTDQQVYENSVVISTIKENNVAATEYEACNLSNNYTDLTNTTINSGGYTDLQSLNDKNKTEPCTYTELQKTPVDIGQDYTTLKTGKHKGDYEEVSSPVLAPTEL